METTQQVKTGIYILLRRPSDVKLPDDDVLLLLNDELRGRVQDMDLGGRDQRTETVDLTIDQDDIDYLINLPEVPEFEPVRLEYSLATPGFASWRDVSIVTGASWANQFDLGRIAASFYGSAALDQGMKLRLNIDPGTLANYLWRLTYRRPLLSILQSGDSPPIPTHFLPMVKLSVAINAMPIVRDDSAEWIAWMNRTLPLYEAELVRWEERWQQYLDSSVEPSTQPIRPFNFFRQRRIRTTRAFLTPQQ
jgi:hypothetical protein